MNAPNNKSALLIVFVVVFIDLLGFGIVLPLLPRYAAHFQASEFQLGMLMASFSAMQFLFAPVWGSLSDRIGRKPVLLLGLAGSAISYALFGYASSLGRDGMLLGMGVLPWLFVTRIGAGIAGATIATAQAVIADTTGKEGRGKGMALIGAAFGIGFTFGPLIGAAFSSGQLVPTLDDTRFAAVTAWETGDKIFGAEVAESLFGPADQWGGSDRRAINSLMEAELSEAEAQRLMLAPVSPAPGYVAALLSGLALLMAIARFRESRQPGSEATGDGHGKRSLATVLAHLQKGALAGILWAIFMTTVAFAQFEATLSMLTEHLGYSNRWNFLMFAYIGVTLMIGQGVLVRRLIPKLGERKMAIIGVVLMTIGMALIGVVGEDLLPRTVLWAVLPVTVIGFSCVTPSLQSLLSQASGADEQGAVLGTGQSLSSLARIVGPVIGFQLRVVSAAAPYFAGAVLMACGAFFVMKLKQSPAEADDAAPTPA